MLTPVVVVMMAVTVVMSVVTVVVAPPVVVVARRRRGRRRRVLDAGDLAVHHAQAVPLRALALAHVLRALRRLVLSIRRAPAARVVPATRDAAGGRPADEQQRQDSAHST